MSENTSKSAVFDAIVLAAGKGTRMNSELPKVLHQACGWTLLRHVAESAVAAGCRHLFIVVGHGQTEVRAEITAWAETGLKTPVTIIEQPEQKGTGDAIRVALPALRATNKGNASVVIMNGDSPLLTPASYQELASCHAAAKADWTVGATELANPTGYGRIFGADGKVERIVEEKDATPEEREQTVVNGGVYVGSLAFLEKYVAALAPSAVTGEIYITDLVKLGVQDGGNVARAMLPAQELRGVNDPIELADAANILWRRKATNLLREGVWVKDPRHVYIDMSVKVAAGAVLEPNVYLLGQTEIAAGAVVESGARLEAAKVGSGARIRAYSCLENCRVHEGAVIGPMARLRPGADIGKDAKIGNFVEVKNAVFAAGAKANHLAYIGDADIGERSNLGCGFITCNYDGAKKHRTVIGKDVFMGSDTQAIAPLSVGDGAYVASGSTVSKDVPAGALAIARVRQENKEGYAKRLMGRMQARKD